MRAPSERNRSRPAAASASRTAPSQSEPSIGRRERLRGNSNQPSTSPIAPAGRFTRKPAPALRSRPRLGSASVTMLASSCPMNAPTHTVATMYEWARRLSRMAAGRRGSVSM
jgi:hypothetical protein